MSQVKKVYFFCTFLGYDLYFSSRFFVLFLGDEPVATVCIQRQIYKFPKGRGRHAIVNIFGGKTVNRREKVENNCDVSVFPFILSQSKNLPFFFFIMLCCHFERVVQFSLIYLNL